MTKEEFKSKIKTAAAIERKKYPMLREGQAIFNEADNYEHVARIVQFDYSIDCTTIYIRVKALVYSSIPVIHLKMF